MQKFAITFILILCCVIIGYTQNDASEKDNSLNKEWKEAIQEAEKALEDIQMPDIDIDKLMDEARQAMPTREEMESYKEVIAEAVRELKKIDLSELEDALDEIGTELENIFGHDRDPSTRKKIE
ncbi:MAG: hypothetical protein HKN76_14860 [Saprospiraceae bacterium]|nr:hypothetical protein [Saprospiraceae bacterium]